MNRTPPNEVAEEPAEDVFVFPATAAQRRFWLLDQLQPGGNPALHMPITLRLRGPIDPSLLELAFNQVIARHESLRTTFENNRGQLRQLISPRLQLDFESSAPFDLARDPLLCARLVRQTAQEHLLEIAVHHIVSDGWSNAILLRDLFAFYTALVEARTPALPELAIQFADFAEWQQARLERDEFSAQRKYWRAKLAGDLPGLDLPYERSARAHTSVGETRSHFLSASLVETARAFAAHEQASAFMLFLAVFQTLLHRYTGQMDFLLTTPSANRERPEFESLIGPLVNPLILRACLRDDPSFARLLGRVRGVVLEAFANQDIPFELLLDEFQAARLQVNFHHDAGLQQPLEMPDGLTSELVAVASAGAVYELSLSVLEEPRGVRLEIEYNPNLFDAGTIERMLGHYETLLASALREPAKPISKLSLLTQAEAQLFEGSPAPNGQPLDLRSALVERVLRKPDAMIARHGRRELSCAELLVRLESGDQETIGGETPTDLDRAATWIEHWRARIDTPLPATPGRSSQMASSLAAGALALRERAQFVELERVASSSRGLAAVEEIGAALMTGAMIVYPTAELLADSATAFASWLELENIAVACLSAGLWNRISAAIAIRKARRPSKLRLVIATEGEVNEGSFGRVDATDEVEILRRVVCEEAGGTIALNESPLPENSARLQVRDSLSGAPSPIGIAGELVIAGQPTGELARRLPNESIERLGPLAVQNYRRGFRIDLRQTENVLQRAPGVRHALVRPIASGPEAAFVAYILPDAAGNGMPPANALRQRLREERAPNLVLPSVFIPLKDIPLRLDSGQLDLAALPSPPAGTAGESSESVRPYLGLQLQLIAIWEEVLGVRGIGIRDDFFELGGNSLLAIRMLQRAEAACGKVILPAALFRHPTIEHLAGEMAREAIDESPSLLHVNDAGPRTPFFYLHGDLSGGGFYSLKLSRALGAAQPFYVMPPQDIRRLPAAPTIEEMAAAHLAALRAVRPKGPYVIGGFCIGGLVAFELAQQIKAGGDEVEMLLIIDAEPESATLRRLRSLVSLAGKIFHWDDDETVRRFGRFAIWRARLAEGIADNLRAQTRQAPRRLYQRVGAVGGALRRRLRPAKEASAPLENGASIEPERDLPSAFQWASAGYQPRSYDGRLALLLSEDVIDATQNPSREWRELAPKISVHALPGNHLECITAHVEMLAKEIESCLDDHSLGPEQNG